MMWLRAKGGLGHTQTLSTSSIRVGNGVEGAAGSCMDHAFVDG
jgi:hypothetical protein